MPGNNLVFIFSACEDNNCRYCDSDPLYCFYCSDHYYDSDGICIGKLYKPLLFFSRRVKRNLLYLKSTQDLLQNFWKHHEEIMFWFFMYSDTCSILNCTMKLILEEGLIVYYDSYISWVIVYLSIWYTPTCYGLLMFVYSANNKTRL